MSDYDRIAQAISYITRYASAQPALNEVASHVHLSPYHFQRLFCRWAGVTPKRFLQVLTLERAKQLLSESRTIIDTANRVGLSSGSRLYDHFVQLEAVTPGEYRQRGAGLTIDYAVHPGPFGKVFIAVTTRGICRLEFIDDDTPERLVSDLRTTWPRATLKKSQRTTAVMVSAIFDTERKFDYPLSLYVSGTNFQVNVWKALLQIPPGKVASYSAIAAALGKPKAARAVGHAVALNPIAFLIPCHRVIQQSGRLGGYHWGETRLHAIHAWETARHE